MLDQETAAKIKQAKDILAEHLLNHPPSGNQKIRTNILLEGIVRALIVLLPDAK
jgi:hypothetical protein